MNFEDLCFKNRGFLSFQAKVSFPNGYGASIIIGEYTYGGSDGLYELAVLHNGEIDYTTPITEDVLGWLTPNEVINYLQQIELLPSK